MLVSDLAALLRISAREAPLLVLERLIRESAREFFREARVWRVDFGGAIQAGSSAYDLTVPANSIAHDIVYAKLDVEDRNLTYLRDAGKAYIGPEYDDTEGTPEYITLLDSDTFQLMPTPHKDDVIEMKVVLTIPRTATEIDDAMIEEFEEVIRDGALARLYEMPGETWSSIQLAQYHRAKAMAGTARAKLRGEETRTPGVRVSSFSW